MRRLKQAVFVLVVAAALTILLAPAKAHAAAEYKQIVTDTVTKAGNYYFKYEGSEVYFSVSPSGPFTRAGFEGYVGTPYTNGTNIIVAGRGQGSYAPLMRCKVKTNKVKTLKKLKRGSWSYEPPQWNISTVYGNKVYLTRDSFEGWNLKTYCYNLSSKKLSMIQNNCAVSARKGKYVVARNEYQTDVSAHRWTIYKIKSNGKFKKVKTLGKYIGSAEIVGNKIYYSKFSEASMKNMKLYRCSLKGKNVKKLGSFQASGQCTAYGYTSKSCSVYKDGSYTYTYATKKLTPKY